MRMVPVSIALMLTACGNPTPEEEVSAYLQAAAECLIDNRTEAAAMMSQGRQREGRFFETSLCGYTEDSLSPEAQEELEREWVRLQPEMLPAWAAGTSADSLSQAEIAISMLVNVLEEAAAQTD